MQGKGDTYGTPSAHEGDVTGREREMCDDRTTQAIAPDALDGDIRETCHPHAPPSLTLYILAESLAEKPSVHWP
jgi:hypothetical protein